MHWGWKLTFIGTLFWCGLVNTANYFEINWEAFLLGFSPLTVWFAIRWISIGKEADD